jgi:hypothetical protein
LPIALFFRLSSAQGLPLLASPCQEYYASKMKKHLFVSTDRRQGGFLNLNPQANSQQKFAMKIHRVHRIYEPGSRVMGITILAF